MAITYVGGHGSSGYGTSTSDTHGLGASIQANDVVVCIVMTIDTGAINDNNTSYTFTESLVDQIGINTGSYFGIFTRVAGASEPSAYSFTLANETNWAAQTRVFRGVDTASPWDVLSYSDYANASATGTTRAASSITTHYDGGMAIAYYLTNLNGVTWASVDNSFTDGLAQNAVYAGMASYVKAIPTAGAVGTTTVTFSPSATIWTGGGIIALRQYVAGFTGLTVTKLLQG